MFGGYRSPKHANMCVSCTAIFASNRSSCKHVLGVHDFELAILHEVLSATVGNSMMLLASKVACILGDTLKLLSSWNKLIKMFAKTTNKDEASRQLCRYRNSDEWEEEKDKVVRNIEHEI